MNSNLFKILIPVLLVALIGSSCNNTAANPPPETAATTVTQTPDDLSATKTPEAISETVEPAQSSPDSPSATLSPEPEPAKSAAPTPMPTITAAVKPTAKPTPGSTPVEATASPTATASGLREFTLEELSKYNGKNENPAYVAVHGLVYDVTDVPEWKNGNHFRGYQAGQDLTDAIENVSPHGVSKLKLVPVVGKLVK